MRRKQWSKVVATVTAAAMAFSGLVMNPDALITANAETDNSVVYLDDAALDEVLGSGGDVLSFTRQAVHDPSIVVTGDTYYVFGSHMGTAKTKDLRNWSMVSGENSASSTLFGTVSGSDVNPISFEQAFRNNAFTGKVKNINGDEVDFGTYDASSWNTDPDVKDDFGNSFGVSGNMWAPDVIYNPTMGKWCMYLSLNGARWNSSVILLTADDVEGPYVYQGPVVYSGFNGTNAVDISTTDLSLIYPNIEETGLPAKYNVGGSWGDVWPHAIDPCVSYDENGNLYLIYGSWSGGIYTLELDENTGLRDYTVSYADDYNSSNPKAVTTDAYFGKKIAGGAYVSGEGAYVEKIGDYWYLFMSYGFYSPEGGYEMRIFRSENIDGPYVDATGDSAIYPSYKMNYGVGGVTNGEKLMGGYQWESMTYGELAQGHNSAFTDANGNSYVVYHTKFDDRGAAHELRVHQLYVNQDGWLVAAPYEYTGETVNNSTLASTSFEASEIAGEYQIIVHRYGMKYAEKELVDLENIVLSADGNVTGDYTGTWAVSEGSYVTITLGDTAYKGVLVEQIIDGTANKTLCFTAKSDAGVSLWGSQTLGDKYAIALTRDALGLKDANNIFPVGGDIFFDVELPTTGSQESVVTWTSSNEAVLGNDGVVTVPAQDTEVTMTCTVTKGSYAYKKEYVVTVMGESSRNGDTTTGLVAKFDFEGDFVDSVNGIVGNAVAQENISKPSITTDKDLNSGVVKFSAGYDAAGTSNYVEIANPLKGSTTGAATISMLVKRADTNVWDPLWGFMSDEDADGVDGNDRFFLTGNPFLGYNGAGGFFDANNSGTVVNAIPSGEWSLVTVAVDANGFDIYIDGAIAFNETYTKAFNSGRGFSDYSDVTDLISSVDTFYLSYGSYWGSAPYRADDLCFYNTALDAADVAALYDEFQEKLENAASGEGDSATGRTYAEIEKYQTYYNDFEDGLGDATVVGTGEVTSVEDERFNKVYENATGEKGVCKNYLLLPSDTIKNATSTGSEEFTIGFWVNANGANVVANAADDFTTVTYHFAPLFSAYGAEPVGTENTWPMMVLQSRLLAQVNCAGYTDFTAAENVAGANKETAEWLKDNEWHYYTATFTQDVVTVYVDGVVQNQWELDGSNGHTVAGLFTNGHELDYVCLGGNQAWTWNDNDAPFMYDEVALFSTALSQAEVNTYMNEIGKPRSYEELKKYETYYNDFEEGLGDAAVVGTGEVTSVEDERFNKVYENATGEKGVCKNYLLLPNDTIKNATSTGSEEFTVGFWVNANGANVVANAADDFTTVTYHFAPLFSAYGAEPVGTENTWPMMVLQSRLLAQVNCAGYTDFTATENVAGANKETAEWLKDNEWHYYTATFTQDVVTVYVDGVVQNQWELDGSNGHTVAGLFTNGHELDYVCLGGNQAWTWNDNDAPFMYDEVSLFSTALTADEIENVMKADASSEDDAKPTPTPTPESTPTPTPIPTPVPRADRDVEVVEAYRTYFNDFEGGLGDATVVGSGEVEEADNEDFGSVYHNATGELGVRKNYLLLPSDSIKNAAMAGNNEMSIGFWVNVADAVNYINSPIFSAYGDAPAETGNTWPMMVLQSRLIAQVNCGGWSDFVNGENVAGVNKIETFWLDDKEWHYYTATISEDFVTVYVDGEVQNQWYFTSGDGNKVAGLFTNGSELDYVCLGGNQAWAWSDVTDYDASYQFDDVAIYSTVLSAGEIADIMEAKVGEKTEETPTPSPDAPAPTEAPTAAPTEAPVVTEAPTQAPEVTEAPTEAPEVTAAPTEAPVVTEAPTQAPEVTEAPTAAPTETPAPEVSIGDVIIQTVVTVGKLLFADTVEEVKEIVDEYIEAISGLWANTNVISEKAMDEMADVEKKIQDKFKSKVDVVSSEGNTFGVTGISNALLTVPKGGKLNVGPATVSEKEVSTAKKLGVTTKQLEEAQTFSLELVDNADGSVKELDAPVAISFSIPDNMKNKELKLLHYLNEDEAELIDVKVKGDGIGEAFVKSFSDFALVAVADAPVSTPTPDDNKDESFVEVILGAISPKMGDDSEGSSWLGIAILGIVCAVAAVTGVTILRKKEEE